MTPKAYLATRDLGGGVKIEEVVKESESNAARDAGYTLTPLVLQPVPHGFVYTDPMPVSGEPVAWEQDAKEFGRALNDAAWALVESWPERMSGHAFNHCKQALRAAILKYAEEVVKTNQPHALAAAQAEVKRLREALELAKRELLEFQHNVDEGHVCFEGGYFHEALSAVKAALSTPADTSVLDRLVADAGRAKWLPIETAPTDGRTLLLGYTNSHGNWRTLRGQWMSQDYIDSFWEDPDAGDPGWYETSVECDEPPNCWFVEPTHWMPLPDAPDDSRAEVKS